MRCAFNASSRTLLTLDRIFDGHYFFFQSEIWFFRRLHATKMNDVENKLLRKGSATPTMKELFAAMVEVDLTRDAAEIMRYIMLLLAYGYCSSPAGVEEQLRRRHFNTRLIACPFERDALPANTRCVNPFQLDANWRDDAPETQRHQCAFYLALNLEGAESAAREQTAYGCASEKDNYNRLRSDCGFLMMPANNTHALLEFAGEVQAADDRAALLAQTPTCVTCGRFPTNVCLLQPLNCCERTMVCDEQCWIAHMEDEHPEVPLEEADSENEEEEQ